MFKTNKDTEVFSRSRGEKNVAVYFSVSNTTDRAKVNKEFSIAPNARHRIEDNDLIYAPFVYEG